MTLTRLIKIALIVFCCAQLGLMLMLALTAIGVSFAPRTTVIVIAMSVGTFLIACTASTYHCCFKQERPDERRTP